MCQAEAASKMGTEALWEYVDALLDRLPDESDISKKLIDSANAAGATLCGSTKMEQDAAFKRLQDAIFDAHLELDKS